MDKTELEDAYELIKQHKLGPSNFDISSVDEPPAGDGVQPIRYKVRVRRGSVERTYAGGHGTKWLEDFERDLRGGVFI